MHQTLSKIILQIRPCLSCQVLGTYVTVVFHLPTIKIDKYISKVSSGPDKIGPRVTIAKPLFCSYSKLL